MFNVDLTPKESQSKHVFTSFVMDLVNLGELRASRRVVIGNWTHAEVLAEIDRQNAIEAEVAQ